jgi:hypothetical protein
MTEIVPDAAPKNTISSEAVVAWTGEKLKMYINMGTAIMDPPAPTRPRIEPIIAPHKAAINISTI